MKLHLPIALLTSLVAVLASPAQAEADRIYTGNNNQKINTSDYTNEVVFQMSGGGTNNYFSSAENKISTTKAAIKIQDDANTTDEVEGLIITNGHTNDVQIFKGALSGNGLLQKTGDGNPNTIVFEGDTSGFTGTIDLSSDRTFTLVFGGNEVAVAAAKSSEDQGIIGNGNITFNSVDKNDDSSLLQTLRFNYAASGDNSVFITNSIKDTGKGTSKLELTGGASYQFTKEVAVDHLTVTEGTKTVFNNTVTAGTLTANGVVTIADGAAVTFNGGSHSNVIVNNGTLTLTGSWSYTKGLYSDGENGLRQDFTVISGNGTVDVSGVTSWLVDGLEGYTYDNGKLTDTTGYYYVNSGNVTYDAGDSFNGVNTLYLNGGNLTLSTGNINIVSGKSASSLTIEEDTELSVDRISGKAVTVSGEGKLIWTPTGEVDASTLPNNISLSSADWSGTVLLKDATVKELKVSVLAPNANTTLELNGVSGYLFGTKYTETFTHNAKIILSGNGLTLNNGFSNNTNQFNGSISGEGQLTLSGPPAHKLIFAGNTAGWTGDITLNSDVAATTSNIIYSGTEEINNAISVTKGKLNLTLSTPGQVTLNKGINVTDLTVTEGTDAVFNSSVTAGTLTANGDVTIAAEATVSTLTANGKVTIADGATATFNGGSLSNAIENNGTLNLAGVWQLGMAAVGGWSDEKNGFELSADSYVFATGNENSICHTEGVTGWKVGDLLLEEGSYTVQGGTLTFNSQTQVSTSYYVNSGTVVYDGGESFDSTISDTATDIVLNGGKLQLTVSLNEQITSGIRVAVNSVIDIRNDAGNDTVLDYSELNFDENTQATLTGNGTLRVDNREVGDSLSSVDMTSTEWSGILHLKNITTPTGNDGGVNLDNIAGNSSLLVLENVSGLLSCEGNISETPVTLEHQTNLQLQGNGLVLNDGFTHITHLFTGEISGNGALSMSGDPSHALIFAGKTAGWTGNISLNSREISEENFITFSGTSEINNESISAARGTLNLNISSPEEVAVKSDISENGGNIRLTVSGSDAVFSGSVDISSLTVEADANTAMTSSEISVDSVDNAGRLSFTGIQALSLTDLTAADGSVLSVGSGVALLADDAVSGPGSVDVSGTAVLEGGSTINGSLDLSGADSIELNNMDEAINVNGDLILVLGETPTLSGNYTEMLENLIDGQSLDIFHVTGSITLNGLELSDGYSEDAGSVIAAIEQGRYSLGYRASAGGNGGTLYLSTASAAAVPEPTTATLSLLALAALASRRRRK